MPVRSLLEGSQLLLKVTPPAMKHLCLLKRCGGQTVVPATRLHPHRHQPVAPHAIHAPRRVLGGLGPRDGGLPGLTVRLIHQGITVGLLHQQRWVVGCQP